MTAELRRFNVICCGRRWGKTTYGVERLIRPALAGKRTAWFSPSNPMLAEIWRDVKSILNPIVAPGGKDERLHRLELVTGGIVKFWSLMDPDSCIGNKYHRVVIDEAAKVRELEYAWFKAIRPTLTDYRGGADFLSTPKGRNFFWKGFTWGEDPAEPDWGCWRMPTASNPYIDPAEIEAARRQLPERVFRQEFLAEFGEDAGGVFRKVADAVDKGRSKAEAPTPGSHYHLGVDLAKVEDFTVLVVVDGNGRQVYHERFNQISWERQIGTILEVAKGYNAHVWIDSTGVGDPPFEAIRKAWPKASGYQFTNSSKEALIENLAMGIEQGKFRLMDVAEQTNELMAYQFELTPSRNVRMNAPEGMHDDCVIALALAAWGMSNRKKWTVR